MLSFDLLCAIFIAIGCQTVAWLWQLKHKNADSVDLSWALSISLIAIYYLFIAQSELTNKVLIIFFPVVWYGRLSLYLWLRIDSAHEDSRYQNLRVHWAKHTQLKFFAFFIFQAGLGFLFALPSYWVLQGPEVPVSVLMVALTWGILCLVSVSVADWQLFQFKANPANKGKVCDEGLWHYSRHPNYFFEWLHWWVYPIVLFTSDYFYGALIFVFLMLVFLLKLTGIPFSEKQALKTRGEAYRKYQESTNAFVLWRKK